MRVIAGKLGGRIFDSPRTNRTHPMSEKARGAIFNALGDVTGLTFLDCYSGTGAVGIEAISRGAAHVTLIDVDPDAVKTIASNVRMLDIEDQCTVLRKNISGWSRNNVAKKFHVVLADPPYTDIRPDVISRLSAHLDDDGTFVLSWPKAEKIREFDGIVKVAHKPLGDIQLVFYKKIM